MAPAGASTKDEVIFLLSRTDLFAGLPADELAECAAKFHKARFGKGAVLFARGDPGNRLYVVAQGRVRLAVATEDGRELSYRHATIGELFGEIAALDGRERSAAATALTPVIAYTLQRSELTALVAAHPLLGAKVIDFLCRRLRDTSNQLESIALYPLEVRVARFLLVALENRQHTPGKRLPLDLGFSQSELAQLLGASRPKVNAALGVLENAGAIKRTIDWMFCDPAKLAEFAKLDAQD